LECITPRLRYASLVANARKMPRLWLVKGSSGWQQGGMSSWAQRRICGSHSSSRPTHVALRTSG